MNQNELAVTAAQTLNSLAEAVVGLSQGRAKSIDFPTLPKHAVRQVIFNNPATVVYWNDGTKTVVRCSENDTFDPEIGLAMAICKKAFGNTGAYNDVFKKWVPGVDEMRRKLIEYCHSHFCHDCELGLPVKKCASALISKGSRDCMTDDEIVDAYNRVFRK